MTLLDCLLEAEKLAYPRDAAMRKIFWPLLTNRQKRTYYYRKDKIVICGDVDKMINSFNQQTFKTRVGWSA